jgi:hypothetical protein
MTRKFNKIRSENIFKKKNQTNGIRIDMSMRCTGVCAVY